MLKTIFLFCLIASTLSHSQQIKILDAGTKQLVPFATVLFSDHGTVLFGDYSNSDGILTIDKNKKFTELTVTYIGYKKAIINFSDIKEAIYLTEDNVILDEVIVSKKTNAQMIGYSGEKKSRYIGAEKGLEDVVFIENTFGKPVQINSFIFKVKRIKSKYAYRIHLYKKGADDFIPGENILKKDIVCFLEPGTKGLVEIELSQYGYEMPVDGIYVGIEGLGSLFDRSNTKNKAPDSFEYEAYKSDATTYCHKYNWANGLHWVNINKWFPENYKLSFNKDMDTNSLVVPSFGLKVNAQ